jgi:hypothetical protein
MCISYFSYSFASRALHIKNKPHVNEVLTDAALLKRYHRHILKLQAELEVSIIYLIACSVIMGYQYFVYDQYFTNECI